MGGGIKAGNHVRQDVLLTVTELVDDQSPYIYKQKRHINRAFYHTFCEISVALSFLQTTFVATLRTTTTLGDSPHEAK